jgi:hypothetical protein
MCTIAQPYAASLHLHHVPMAARGQRILPIMGQVGEFPEPVGPTKLGVDSPAAGLGA